MQAKQTSSGLIIISSQDPGQRREVLRCSTCKTDFPLEQQAAFDRHVVRCADVNHDIVEAELAAKEDSYLTSSADPEMFAHLRNGGN